MTNVIYPSGIEVKAVYGPEDLERIGFDYEQDGNTGLYPFTCNTFLLGYRSRETTRQYAGFGTPHIPKKGQG